MLLQRLVQYAARSPDAKPFHREREFQWQLNLDASGALLSKELQQVVRPDDRGRPRGVPHVVPTSVRTVGVAANLAADDVQYVLGWADEASKPQRVAQCHAAFVDLVRRWADSPDGKVDPVAGAVATFYAAGGAAEVIRPPQWSSKQGVVIAVDGLHAFNAPSVVPFWLAEIASRKGGGRDGLCLVCGQVAPLLDTVPGKVPGRWVPGASNDAALVSVNERVFGYGLTTQLTHTPLCLACGEAVPAALVRLLSSEDAVSFGGQDSRLAWWLTEDREFDAMAMLNEPDPVQVHALLHDLHRGRSSAEGDDLDPAMFCALTVGGNVARVMVRDWIEMPLDELQTNVRGWFADQQLINPWEPERTVAGLGRLALVTGRWLRDRKRYADFGAKGADRPDGVQRDLLRAAIHRRPLPPSLLVHLVHRVRTDGHLDHARAALLRLGLTRSPTMSEDPMPHLDPSNTDPAYVAGRAFALLETIQRDAVDPGTKLNTTYSDRYFAGAVINPRAALVAGERTARAWLKKIRRRSPGLAVNDEKALDDVLTLIDVQRGIPSRTTLRQQSLFLLGYHHQGSHTIAARADARARRADAGITEPIAAVVDTTPEEEISE